MSHMFFAFTHACAIQFVSNLYRIAAELMEVFTWLCIL